MKTPYLTYRFGCRPIPDGHNFLLIHLDTLCSYNIAKKHNFLHAKGTLFKISIQFLTTQHTKYITQMIKIFFFGKLTYVLKEEDTNIIRGIPQIYNDNRNIKQQMATG